MCRPLKPAERVVDLAASDGTKLKATYFAAGKPGPGVLLLHQCNRQRKVWDGLARQLAAAGINVLTFDLRGFGESGGEPFAKLTPQQAAIEMAKVPGDIDTALQYLWSQPGVNRNVTGVGGASCGVNNSVQTARRHPEVKSLVLLSGNSDLNGRNYLRSPPLLRSSSPSPTMTSFHPPSFRLSGFTVSPTIPARPWSITRRADTGPTYLTCIRS